jgi:glycerol-3-phosphate acyltransferase PlsY
MVLEFSVTVIIGYLVGSVPLAYLLAKRSQGVDLRCYGSGNVGTSNLLSLTSWRLARPVLAFDFCKGLVMVWLAWNIGLSSIEQLLVGLAVVCGHNWPLFLGFRGGRGVLTTFGASFLIPLLNGFISPVIFAIMGAIMLSMILISIYILKKGSLGVLIAVISLPLLGFAQGLPSSINLGLLGMVIVFIIRRLTAPQPIRNVSISNRNRLMNRILYDREVKDNQIWMSLIRKENDQRSLSNPEGGCESADYPDSDAGMG